MEFVIKIIFQIEVALNLMGCRDDIVIVTNHLNSLCISIIIILSARIAKLVHESLESLR